MNNLSAQNKKVFGFSNFHGFTTKALMSCFLLSFSLVSNAILADETKGLDEKFLRNGECYMLIGETQVLRGIYRLNNPVKDITQLNKLVIAGSRFNNSFGFAADLDRNLYTFTETKDSGFHLKTGSIYRQVLTGVPQYLTDYGYYTWHHHDSRNIPELNRHVYRRVDGGASYREPGKHSRNRGNCHSGCPNVYRLGWCGWVALNPGSPVTPPKGYKLPEIKKETPWSKQYCPEVAGVSWYAIPNGQWYASWRHSDGNGYLNYVDYDYILEHHYMKWSWINTLKESDEVDYPAPAQGNEVAASAETKTTRNSVNGCLDSCGADTSLGSAPAKEMTVDIAMQPPMLGGGGDRVYSLARDVGAELYDLKLAEGGAAAKEYKKGWLRGTPNVANSKWIGISLKNANQDYVYVMGEDTIKRWYKTCWPDTPQSKIDVMKIECVGVSNRWDQKGGIIYAYDSYYNNIYKFNCIDFGTSVEQENPGVDNSRFESISVGKAIDVLGGNGNLAKIDDIKADGFGSVFFGLSYPSPKTSLSGLRKYFKEDYAVHMCQTGFGEPDKDEEGNPVGDPYYRINIVLKMEYAKVVFERNINGGAIREIGRRPFAWDYYSIQREVSKQCFDELNALSWPNKSWVGIIQKYPPKADSADDPLTSNNWKDFIVATNGACEHSDDYKNIDLTDPGHCKLAVINVPTPDKVIALSGYNSYLDIIGPYHTFTSWTQYEDGSLSTDQDKNLYNEAALKKNTLYYYMVENYPMEPAGVNPKLQPDWDQDGRHGGFITTIGDRNPYRKQKPNEILGKDIQPDEIHEEGVKYEWRTWMVLDLYGNSCCELIQEADPNGEGAPYNFMYSPVFGKFIMTCRVKYKWYNYDYVPFGGNIDDMKLGKYDGVIRPWTWTIPVDKYAGSYIQQKGEARLNEIMDSFTFNGRYFMRDPRDQDNEKIQVDYSQIYTYVSSFSQEVGMGDDPFGEYMAMEPISVGVATDTPPTQATNTALIQRCDNIPDYPIENYIYNNDYWATAPAETDCFVVKAGEIYNWRICLASQTNMLDLTYLRDEMKDNEKSTFYANGDPEHLVFKGELTGNKPDLRWADDKILVSASLQYYVPTAGGGYEKKEYPLLESSSDSSSGENEKAKTKFEHPFIVDSNPNNPKNLVFYTSAGDLPTTEPYEAEIIINMRRQYKYSVWALQNGLPRFRIPNLPGWFKITGKAKIIVLDAENSRIVWDKTSHNNLFGITGCPITVGDGPGKGKTGKGNGKNVNPEYVEFVIKDNNPWEATDSYPNIVEEVDNISIIHKPIIVSLSEHINNYAYNYGNSSATLYCDANPKLKALYHGGGINIKSQIEQAKLAKAPSAKFNYKPLFSKAARDVRIMFETAKRNTDDQSAEKLGKVEVNRADKLYSNLNTRDFNSNESNYAFHYHDDDNGNKKHEKYLLWTKEKSTFSDLIGGTNEPTATNYYNFSVPNLEIGTKYNGFDASPRYSTNNIVPDGYANNTPGYRPYKFYISVTDSSGNYIRDVELNVALHVKDDIPPIGYGSVFDYKYKALSYFPTQTKVASDSLNAPCYGLDGENYFGTSLNPDIVRADWLPATSGAEGYINNSNPSNGTTYRSLKSLGDSVSTGIKDADFISQIDNGVTPHSVEDNVECDFETFVSDNCGLATATMSLVYFATDGRDTGGTPKEKTGTIVSTWTSGADIASGSSSNVASTTGEVYHTIFRGRSEHFLMGVPITIESVDNARDWDYYNDPAGSVTSDNIWKWGTLNRGNDSPNKRVFKTTLPVHGSYLDIRNLERTIKNE